MAKKTGKPFRLRVLIRRIIAGILPRKWAYANLRKGLRLDLTLPPNLTFKIADTREELEAAFQLLHDRYVQSGYMDPHPSGLRVTKYHSLPSTTTLIAKWDDQVVGTVSMVRRSSFGVPLESIFDISSILATGERVLEVSALAIRPDFSGKHGQILFPLIKFLIRYSLEYFGTKYFVIAVHPTWIDFYRAILLFQPLTKHNLVDTYSFVNGAPAVGGVLNLEQLKVDSIKVYAGEPPERHFHNYLWKMETPNFRFPDRTFRKISDPVLTPNLLDYFFNQKTKTLSEMNEREISVLRELYKEESFRAVLPEPPTRTNAFYLRRERRFETQCHGVIRTPKSLPIPLIVTDVSEKGIRVLANRHLRDNEIYQLEVEVGDSEIAKLSARKLWNEGSTLIYGMEILDSTVEWTNFVNRHLMDFQRKVS